MQIAFSNYRKSNTTGWVLNLGVTRRTSSPLSSRQRRVIKLIKHPGFQMSIDHYYSDDIALVLLEEKVDFDEFLRPVCLPANSSVQLKPGTISHFISKLGLIDHPFSHRNRLLCYWMGKKDPRRLR